MQLEKMNKKDLLERINVLNQQITELETGRNVTGNDDSDRFLADIQFKNVFATAPVGLIITDIDGQIVNVNKAAQEMMGYSIEEIGKENINDYYANIDDRKALLNRLKKENRVIGFETKIRHKNGTVKSVLLNADFIELDSKKALLTSVVDVSWCKNAEDFFIESEEEYELLFSNAPIGITVTDVQGQLILSNRALCELLGYTQKELETIDVTDFYSDPSDRKHLLDQLDKIGAVRDFETKFKHKNGRIINVLLNMDKIDFKGKKEALLTSIRSIGTLKQIEAELTKERDFISAVLDIAASLVMVLDRKGKITQFNHACEVISGYDFNEVKDKSIWDVLTDDSEIAKNRFNALLKGNYPNKHESVWKSKNGKEHLISWTNTVLLDPFGKVEFVIGTGIDITDQKKSQRSLRYANDRLLSWVSDLEKRTNHMNLLSELGEQLQICQDEREACVISSRYIQRMFQGSSGALYLIDRERGLAEAVELWGDVDSMEKLFTPTDCWAIKNGKSYLIDEEHKGLRCKHILGPSVGKYLCVPMLINGEAIGILYINHKSVKTRDQSDASFELQQDNELQLITTISEYIALSLSNIRLRATLRKQSIIDVLTGLYNRRYMQESLQKELVRAGYDEKNVGLIIFDVDHFKQFNDVMGHDAGDALLREIGKFIKSAVRDSDVPCRYGGDEFVILLPGANIEQTKKRADQIRKGIKEIEIQHLGQTLDQCTISVGVAVFPEHGKDIQSILKSADIALYEAKEAGRDRIQVAPTML